jgi:exosortase
MAEGSLPLPTSVMSRGIVKHWPLVAGFAVLAVPTIITLGRQDWSRESGAHGPIVLATGAWLISRQANSFQDLKAPSSNLLSAVILVISLLVGMAGYAFDFATFEAAGLYGVGLTMLYSVFGLPPLLKNWFPLFYFGFCVPPPHWAVDQVTAPLKQFVSFVATSSLHAVGLPISREGVTIQVASYQLLVEDACSGMNSLIGLSAISLFYIYLLRGASWRYAGVLTLLVVPIAIIGNILRIMVLILLTNFFGDQVAQGFAHFTAGIFLFGVSLLLVFLADHLLARILPRSWRETA